MDRNAVIDRPIFIVGSGRSGTTLLLDLMTKHPELSWFSNLNDRYPDRMWLSVFSRLWDIPFLGPKIAGRIPALLHSDETIRIYYYCGIHNLHWVKQTSLTEEDLTPKAAACLQELVSQNLRYSGKKRFINKNTNNCMRIRYLKAVFPEAKFIHILRDGRAVANSLFHVDWWPDLRLWWSGYTPNEWKAAGNPPIELCGRHWQRQVEEVLSAVPYLNKEDYIELWYETLAENPIQEMRNLIEFCGLRWTSSFEKAVNETRIQNFNFKWREQLSTEDQTILENTIGDFLQSINCPIGV